MKKIIVKKDGSVVQFSLSALKAEYPNVSFPRRLDTVALDEFNVFELTDFAPPSYNKTTQFLTHVGFEEFEPGKWRDVWRVEDYPLPVGDVKAQSLVALLNSSVGTVMNALKKAFPDVDIMSALFATIDESFAPAAWSGSANYSVGDLVTHDGKVFMALPDVAHSPPDDIYDADNMTGGWMPV